MVHQELDAFAMGVFVQGFNFEIGIRLGEAVDLLKGVVLPVLPAFIPALNEDFVDFVRGREIDVTLDVFGAGAMVRARRPGLRAGDHFPPDSDIFDRVDPAYVFDCAGLVQVQDERLAEHVAGVVADLHRAPGCVLCQAAFAAVRAGGEMGPEGVSVLQLEAHRAEICAGGFVDVDIKAVVSLQLERSLHSGRGEGFVRPVGLLRLGHPRFDLAEPGLLGDVLLGVVIAGDPPDGVVCSEFKFGEFFFYCSLSRLGEFIPEAHAVVVGSEPYDEAFSEVDFELVVEIPYFTGLAPNGLPGFVFGTGFGGN